VKVTEICLDLLVPRIIHVTRVGNKLLCLLLRDISLLNDSELHIPGIPKSKEDWKKTF